MATTQLASVPALVEPDYDSFAVRQAIAGFLAGYGDATREACSLDLRHWLGCSCTADPVVAGTLLVLARCRVTPHDG